jgi:hypothetical protein
MGPGPASRQRAIPAGAFRRTIFRPNSADNFHSVTSIRQIGAESMLAKQPNLPGPLVAGEFPSLSDSAIELPWKY